MTDLSNIFVGKRVVQKAYLNNALIYQSKGWEPTDNACTEAWDKQVTISRNASAYIKQCTTDKDNNIYFISSGNIYKVNSSTCALIHDSCKSDYIVYEYYFDEVDNIFYCLGQDSISSVHKSIFTIDTNLNFLNHIIELDTVSAIGNNANYMDSITVDNSYIYMTCDVGGSYQDLYVIDKGGKYKYSVSLPECMPVITTYNGDYFYTSRQGSLLQFNKKNFASADISLSVPAPTNTTTDRSVIFKGIIDINGNILFNSMYRGVIKITSDGKWLTSYLGHANSSNIGETQLATDYKGNTYILDKNYYSKDVVLSKITSDTTEQYHVTLLNDRNFSNVESGAEYSNICVDRNGNIYIIYMYQSGAVNIKKIFNIVKN